MSVSLEKIEKWGEKKKGKKLIRLLYNNNVEIRVHAIRALANLEDPEIINTLVNLLRDPIPDVRLTTTETLGKIGSERSAEFIRFMLENEKEENVIKAAKDALVAIREKIENEETA